MGSSSGTAAIAGRHGLPGAIMAENVETVDISVNTAFENLIVNQTVDIEGVELVSTGPQLAECWKN